MLELHYYKENEDEFTKREVEPYQLVNGPEGWYLGCYDLGRDDTRHFRLDRIKEAALTDATFEPRAGVEERLAEQEWLVHGEVATAGVARVWVSPRPGPVAARGADRRRGAGRRRGRRRGSLRVERRGSSARC